MSIQNTKTKCETLSWPRSNRLLQTSISRIPQYLLSHPCMYIFEVIIYYKFKYKFKYMTTVKRHVYGYNK